MVDVSPEGGGEIQISSIEGSFDPPYYPYGYDFTPGSAVDLKAMPSLGYRFVEWTGSLTGSDESANLIMDCSDYVTAAFVPITYTLTVTVSPDTGGEVFINFPQPDEGYLAGAEVTLMATASEGYKFSHWSGAVSGSENPMTITMDSAKELSANFAELPPQQFPWWWVVVGVVVIGLLAYLLMARRVRSWGN